MFLTKKQKKIIVEECSLREATVLFKEETEISCLFFTLMNSKKIVRIVICSE